VKQVADGVWQLRGFPPNAINVYLAEDVLIDAGTRRSARRILRQLDGRTVRAHALTHAHPDHQGSSDEVCGKLGIEYWVGRRKCLTPCVPRGFATFNRAIRTPGW
jgi:hydroxyacylglutathione hydrolase